APAPPGDTFERPEVVERLRRLDAAREPEELLRVFLADVVGFGADEIAGFEAAPYYPARVAAAGTVGREPTADAAGRDGLAGVSADAFLSRSPFDESAGYGRIGHATAGMRSRQTRPRSNRQGTVNDDTAGGVVGQRATSAAGPEAQRSVALPRRDSWRMDDDASRRLLDVAPVAILGQRLDGSVSYANPAAARLFGWERDEMLGRNVEETFIADQNRHRDVEVMGILTSDRSWSGELPLRHRDGTVFPGHVTATLTRDARGEPDGIVGTVVDLRPIYSARAEV